MSKLDEVDADALRARLAEVESAKAAKRLMVTLAYLDGESVSTLATRYSIPRSTLYYWLDRFEHRSLDEAVEDDPRPGRPRKLDPDEVTALVADLRASPTDHGYDEDEWTPELLVRHVDATLGVEYSTGHARRLLDEFGP